MVDSLIDDIIDKKELRGAQRAYVKKYIERWFDKHPAPQQAYQEDPGGFMKQKVYKTLRSEVRAHLRRVYGIFFTNKYPAKRDDLLAQLREQPTQAHAHALMEIHRSTQERLASYPALYEQIFAVTGTPNSILDLGCGYNPFSYPFLGCTPDYHSVDIACDDLERVGTFHESLGIRHSQHCIDLTRKDALKNVPAADVAFAFKVFDSLDEGEWSVTERLLTELRADWLVASFPTKSVDQTKYVRPRKWFEGLVTGKVAGRVTLANEQFFIITLKQKRAVTHTQQ